MTDLDDSPRARVVQGVRAQAPALVGVVPFGLVTGIACVAAGMTPFETIALSILAFSGIAQLVAAQLFGAGTPFAVILATVVVISLRLVMYSASLSGHFAHLRLRDKVTVAYFLTDHAYALTVVEFGRHPHRANGHWFLIGTGVISWTVWQITVAAGAIAGAQVPASWSLEFSVTLTFLALAVPLLADRPAWIAAIAAGSVAVLAQGMPFRLGLITATLAGIAAALAASALERRWSGS